VYINVIVGGVWRATEHQLTLERLKLHAFGRIDSSHLTTVGVDSAVTVMSQQLNLNENNCDTQMTRVVDHQRRNNESTHFNSLDSHDVSTEHRHMQQSRPTDSESQTSQTNDMTDSDRSKTKTTTHEHGQSRDWVAAIDGLQDSEQHHQLGHTCKPHSNTDYRHTTTTPTTTCCRSSVMAASYWLTDAERRRQRQNVELIRELTAHADVISDHIAAVVDDEFLALPATRIHRLSSLELK